ncbi:MAG: class I SAM-dependent methyltransferase [Candidatus Hodarchaeota archaeon]
MVIKKEYIINLFNRKYDLKSLQSEYEKIINEYFSGLRGIVKSEPIGESVIFKVRYIYELLNCFTQTLNASNDKRIVDFGCERGDMLLLLKKIGFINLCGVNLTPYNDNWLKKGVIFDDLFGNGKNKINYVVCDMDKNKLPFNDNEINVAILSDVLEHLHNPGWVLAEINRVMKSEGLLVIGTPNIASIKNRISLLFGNTIHGTLDSWLSTHYRLSGQYVGHTREYSMKELKKIMQLYGFTPIKWSFIPTLVLLGEMRNRIPTFVFKIYSFFEKIWPGGRHRIVMVSQKTLKEISDYWIPKPNYLEEV